MDVLRRTDHWITLTRPAWMWAGQVALVVLGIHLAADQLDDRLQPLLAAAPLPWPRPGTPGLVATWVAVVTELLASARATWLLLRSPREPSAPRPPWRERLSVQTIVVPLFWGIAALSGAWVVTMAVEDALAPYAPAMAAVLGPVIGLLLLWRLGGTGWRRVTAGLPARRRWTDGALWAPLLLLLAGLGAWHGLPLWGWT